MLSSQKGWVRKILFGSIQKETAEKRPGFCWLPRMLLVGIAFLFYQAKDESYFTPIIAQKYTLEPKVNVCQVISEIETQES